MQNNKNWIWAALAVGAGVYLMTKGEKQEKLKGGLGDNKEDIEFDEFELRRGMEHELEHTDDFEIAKEIAKDHLTEDPFYYDRLDSIKNAMREDSEVENG